MVPLEDAGLSIIQKFRSGADLGVMDRDAKLQRGARPFLFCDLKREHNLDAVIAWIEHEVLFGQKPAVASR